MQSLYCILNFMYIILYSYKILNRKVYFINIRSWKNQLTKCRIVVLAAIYGTDIVQFKIFDYIYTFPRIMLRSKKKFERELVIRDQNIICLCIRMISSFHRIPLIGSIQVLIFFKLNEYNLFRNKYGFIVPLLRSCETLALCTNLSFPCHTHSK